MYPNTKVGIVTFNDEITIIGDGKGDPVTIAGDKLNKFDDIVSSVENKYEQLFTQPISNTAKDLVASLEKLKEGG